MPAPLREQCLAEGRGFPKPSLLSTPADSLLSCAEAEWVVQGKEHEMWSQTTRPGFKT